MPGIKWQAAGDLDLFNGMDATLWTGNHWEIPLVAVGIYSVMLLTLIPYMRSRPAPNRNVLNPIVAVRCSAIQTPRLCGMGWRVY